MDSEFGRVDVVPNGTAPCNSDPECAEAVESGLPILPVAGVLAHSLGVGSLPASPGQPCIILGIDRIVVIAKSSRGESFSFSAISDITFGNYWHGQFHVVTSTGWSGGREVCPRAHPGDGVLDYLRIEESMSFRQRLKARRKMRSGSHLPHPGLRVSRIESLILQGPNLLTVDGVPRGRYVLVECCIDPGRAQVVMPIATTN